jgi:hypothetical protein
MKKMSRWLFEARLSLHFPFFSTGGCACRYCEGHLQELERWAASSSIKGSVYCREWVQLQCPKYIWLLQILIWSPTVKA